MAEKNQFSPEMLGQVEPYVTKEGLKKLTDIVAELAEPIANLQDTDPSNDAAARKAIAAKKTAVVNVLQNNATTLGSFVVQYVILPKVQTAFDALDIEDEPARKTKVEEAKLNEEERAQVPDPMAAFLMLLIGFFTGNQEMIQQGMEAFSGATTNTPTQPVAPVSGETKPATSAAPPVVNTKFTTSQAAKQELGNISSRVEQLKAQRGNITLEDITSKTTAFQQKITSNTRAVENKPINPAEEYRKNLEKYYLNSDTAIVLTGARKNKFTYAEEEIGTSGKFLIPIKYDASIDGKINELNNTKKPALLVWEDHGTTLASHGQYLANQELRNKNIEQLVKDPQYNMAEIQRSLNAEKGLLPDKQVKLEISQSTYEERLKEMQRLKAIQGVLKDYKGSSWYESADEAIKDKARPVLKEEIERLEPELNKAKKEFEKKIKEFEDANIEVGKLEAQKALLSSPEFTALKTAAEHNVAAKQQQEALDKNIQQLQAAQGDVQVAIGQLRDKEGREAQAQVKREQERQMQEIQQAANNIGPASRVSDVGVPPAPSDTLIPPPPFKQSAEGLPSSPAIDREEQQRQLAAAAGIGAQQKKASRYSHGIEFPHAEKLPDINSDIQSKKDELNSLKAQWEKMDEYVREAHSIANIARVKGEYPVRDGQYYFYTNVSTAGNLGVLNQNVGATVSQTPNVFARYQDKVTRAILQEDATAIKRHANELDKDTKGDRDTLAKQIAVLEKDITYLRGELRHYGGEPVDLKTAQLAKDVAEIMGVPAHILLTDDKTKKLFDQFHQQKRLDDMYNETLDQPLRQDKPRRHLHEDDQFKSTFANAGDRKHEDEQAVEVGNKINTRKKFARLNTLEAAGEHREEMGKTIEKLAQSALTGYQRELETEVRKIEHKIHQVETAKGSLLQATETIQQKVEKSLENPANIDLLIAQGKALYQQGDKMKYLGGENAAKLFYDTADLIKHAIGDAPKDANEPLLTSKEKEGIKLAMQNVSVALENKIDVDKEALEDSIKKLSDKMHKVTGGTNQAVASLQQTISNKPNGAPGSHSKA